MNDNEIHFYDDDHHFNKKWLLLIPAIAIVIALIHMGYHHSWNDGKAITGKQETTEENREIDTPIATDTTIVNTLLSKKSDGNLLMLDTLINDIPITLFVPLHAKPQLRLGYDVLRDTSNIVLCLAAADAGKHDKIVGAYVCNGRLVSNGLSKKGFCAITNDSVTIGMAESSPFFEKAINDSGYFFRQRTLVDCGHIIKNELRGQFLCRALCKKEGLTCVVICRERCSLYDFAQILTDIGVTHAISLQSAKNAKGWYHTMEGHVNLLGDWSSRKFPKSANYIVWSKSE